MFKSFLKIRMPCVEFFMVTWSGVALFFCISQSLSDTFEAPAWALADCKM